jgi:hypothetical protein
LSSLRGAFEPLDQMDGRAARFIDRGKVGRPSRPTTLQAIDASGRVLRMKMIR